MTRTAWEPEWMFLRRPDMGAHLREKGCMRLIPGRQTLRDKLPTFAGLRPRGFDNVTETRFRFTPEQPGDEAGLAVRLDMNFHITCLAAHVPGGRAITLTLQAEDITHVIASIPVAAEGDITLRMTADREKYVFACAVGDGEMQPVGQCSTRFVATELQGRCFTGTVIGLYAACREKTGAEMQVLSFRHG